MFIDKYASKRIYEFMYRDNASDGTFQTSKVRKQTINK